MIGATDPAATATREKDRSVSKRFTSAFIGVVTLLLVAFAAIVIVVNVRKMDAELRDLLADLARLSQISLAVPVWNLDTEAVGTFAEALLLREPLAFVEILSEGQSIAARSQPEFRGNPFSSFTGSSGFLVKTVDIVHQGKKIGVVHLVVSRSGVHQAILWYIAGILALTVGIIASIYATSIVITQRYVARPLEALQRSAGLIASGNLSAPIDRTHRDEIGHLARDLDAMRSSLQSLIEERRRNEERLEESNRTLEQKVEERTSALQAKTQELTQTVEELRALGEVGRAVSSTLDLETVLTIIVSHAVQLTGTDGGAIYEYDAGVGTFHLRATHQMHEDLIEALRSHPPRFGEGTIGHAAATRLPVQIADIEEDTTYGERLRGLFRRHGFRARLAVPLVREDQIVGALVVRRKAPGAFPPELAELLQTFATQSVLAIQNARLFREIEEKGRELQLASQHKSQFLANMSHELRTPMNAIIGVSEMLLEDARDLKHDDQIEPLERILRAGRHLLALINDILDLSKIEAGRMELHLESFSIGSLIEDVVTTIGPLAEKNANRVQLECPADLGSMRADPTRVRQALLNLTSNAAKFTEGGVITITAARRRQDDGDWITVAVADTGIGMTEEQTGRLFQDFMQADASTTRKYGGTGLGLSISRRFCRLMGGDITVESATGRGSTFTISLPATVERAIEETASPLMRPPAPASPGPLPLVLVVDDDRTVRELMERFLVKEGFSVITAAGGVEALARARQFGPAAMTLDVMMPDLDGWTVLAALKGDPALADIPVIVVTILDERNRGFALGAAEYMVKPVDRDRLLKLLRTICGRQPGRVLLIEDDEVTRAVIHQILSQDGWTIDQAENGRIGLERLAAAVPDVIVLDLMMPEMDGFEFLAELRSRPDLRDVPVLVVTAKDLTEDDRCRLNGGVERVILKRGSDPDELLSELRRALATSVERRRAS